MSTQHLVAHSPLGFVVAFGAGMVSFLSPCVLPLVPGYLSLMSGVGTQRLSVATRTDQRKLVRATVLFVLGFTAVFVALGATASTVGTLLKDHQTGLNQAAGVVIIVSGVAFGRLAGLFAGVKRHFRIINLISGAVLVVFGILLLTNSVSRLSNWFIRLPGLNH